MGRTHGWVVDLKNTYAGKILASVVAIVLALSMINLNAFAEGGAPPPEEPPAIEEADSPSEDLSPISDRPIDSAASANAAAEDAATRAEGAHTEAIDNSKAPSQVQARVPDSPNGDSAVYKTEGHEDDSGLSYPAADLRVVASDGTVVNLSADAGVLPAGTVMQANPVQITQEAEQSVEGAVASESRSLFEYKAYDIRLLFDGEEIQPNGQVMVSFENTGIEADSIEVIHVDEQDNAEIVATGATEAEAAAAVDHFSIYVVGGSAFWDAVGQSASNPYIVESGGTLELFSTLISFTSGIEGTSAWSVTSGPGSVRLNSYLKHDDPNAVDGKYYPSTVYTAPQVTESTSVIVRYRYTLSGSSGMQYFYITVEPEDGGGTVGPGPGDEQIPGNTALSKTAVPTKSGEKDGDGIWEWQVNLGVRGFDVVKKTSVVLVIDCSNSMNPNYSGGPRIDRIGMAKTAAKAFVDQALAGGNTEIAVVKFAGSASTVSTWSQDATALKNAIDSITCTNSTNIEAGIATGQDLLSSATFANSSKYMILLGDGEANASNTQGYTNTNNAVRAAGSAKSAGTTMYAIGLGLGEDTIGEKTLKQCSNDYNQLNYVFSNPPYIASGYYHRVSDAAGAAGLTEVYKKIAGEISYAANNAQAVDPIGEKFTIPLSANGSFADNLKVTVGDPARIYELNVSASAEVMGATIGTDGGGSPVTYTWNIAAEGIALTYDLATRTFTWDIAKVEESNFWYYLSYTVRINNSTSLEEMGMSPGDEGYDELFADSFIAYETNGETTLAYTDSNGDGVEKEFTSPTVGYPQIGSITIVYYEVLPGTGGTLFPYTSQHVLITSGNTEDRNIIEHLFTKKFEDPDFENRGPDDLRTDPTVLIVDENKEYEVTAEPYITAADGTVYELVTVTDTVNTQTLGDPIPMDITLTAAYPDQSVYFAYVKVDSTDIEVDKIWEDGDDATYRDDVVLTLTGTVASFPNFTITRTQTIPWGAEPQAYATVFESVPLTYQGQAITYTLAEAPIADYDTVITNKEEAGQIDPYHYIVTNTFGTVEHEGEATVDFSFEKLWPEAGAPEGARVTFTLYKDGAPYEDNGSPATVVLDGSEEWKHAWTGLPSGDYNVVETPFDGYIPIYDDVATSVVVGDIAIIDPCRKITFSNIEDAYVVMKVGAGDTAAYKLWTYTELDADEISAFVDSFNEAVEAKGSDFGRLDASSPNLSVGNGLGTVSFGGTPENLVKADEQGSIEFSKGGWTQFAYGILKTEASQEVTNHDSFTKEVFDGNGIEINGDTVYVGQTFDYVIEYTNPYTGANAPSQAVELSDDMPEGLQIVSAKVTVGGVDVDPADVSLTDDSFSFIAQDLAPGETVKAVITVKVVSIPADSVVENKATALVDGETYATDKTENTVEAGAVKDVMCDIADSQGDSVYASIDGTVVYVGQTFDYTIAYTNPNPAEGVENPLAQLISASDELPEGVDFVRAIARVGDLTVPAPTQANGIVEWEGSLAAGATLTITITVTVNAAALGSGETSSTIENQANVSIDEMPTATNEVSNEVRPGGTKEAVDDKGVVINGETVYVGQTFDYVISYTNSNPASGPDALSQKVKLADTLPAGLKVTGVAIGGNAIDDISEVYTPATRIFEYTEDALAPGATVKAVITVYVESIPEGTVMFENKATLDIDGSIAATDIVETPVKPGAEKAATKESVFVGEEFSYTITYKNETGEKQTVVVSDTLPQGAAYVGSAAAIDDKAAAVPTWQGAALSWTGELDSDETLVVMIDVIATDEALTQGALTATVKNWATLTINDAPVVTNEVTTEIKQGAVKKGESEGAFIGQEYTYTITYTNPNQVGGTNQDVVLTDSLEPGISYVASTVAVADSTGVDIDDAVITNENGLGDTSLAWAVEGLKPQQTVTVTLTVFVSPEAAEFDEITNQAYFEVDGGKAIGTNVVETAVLPGLTKTDGLQGGHIEIGETMTYTIVFTNSTENALTNTKVTDALPVEVEYVSSTLDGIASDDSYDEDTHSLTWTIPLLDDKAYATMKVTVRVIASNEDEAITNTAQASFMYGDDEKELMATVTTPVKPGLTKDDGLAGNDVMVGEELTYTITYTNSGNTVLTDVKVADALPEGVDFKESSINGGDPLDGSEYDSASHSLNWTLPAVSVNEVVEIAVKVRVNEKAIDPITNKATVETKDKEYEGSVTTPVIPGATKSVSDAVVYSGQAFTYEISYVNDTDGPVAVSMSDTLPAGVDYIDAKALPAGGALKEDGGTVSWTGSLASKAELKVTVTVRANGTEEVVRNRAALTIGTRNVTTEEVSTVVLAGAVKDAVNDGISIDNAKVFQGQTFDYTIAYTNEGRADLNEFESQAISVSDVIPVGLSVKETTAMIAGSRAPANPAYDQTSRTLTWSGVVRYGEELVITITVAVDFDASGLLANKADFSIDGMPLITNEVRNPISDGATKKASDEGEVQVGDRLSYTITYANTGEFGTPAESIAVSDALPAGTRYVSSNATIGAALVAAPTYSNGAVAWSGTLSAKQTLVIQITVEVTDAAIDPISNQASVRVGNSSFVTNPTLNDRTPVELVVTITGNNATYAWNGSAQEANGYRYIVTRDGVDVTSQDLVSVNLVQGAEAKAARTEVGRTDMELMRDSFTVTPKNANYTVRYSVIDGWVQITPVGTVVIPINGGLKMYDGTPIAATSHGAVTGLHEGDYIDQITYTGSITDVGTATASADASSIVIRNRTTGQVTNSSYAGIQVTSSPLQVTARQIILTSGSASKVYDGTPIADTAMYVTGDGFVAGQGATWYVYGSRTEAGSEPNYFSYGWQTGTNPSNYSIQVVYGTLTIIPVTPIPPPPFIIPPIVPDPPVTPAAPADTTIPDTPTPTAPTPTTPTPQEIPDDETPLAEKPYCWVHWYILAGMVLTVVYAIGVIFRRKRFANKLDDYEDKALGGPDEQTQETKIPAGQGA